MPVFLLFKISEETIVAEPEREEISEPSDHKSEPDPKTQEPQPEETEPGRFGVLGIMSRFLEG